MGLVYQAPPAASSSVAYLRELVHYKPASKSLSLPAPCIPSESELTWQRNRPEPVKDDMGNIGAVRAPGLAALALNTVLCAAAKVQKPNVKEMGASIALVVVGPGPELMVRCSPPPTHAPLPGRSSALACR